MSEERDIWPPRVGQTVWIKPTGGLGTVLELLPGDRVAVRRALSCGTVTPGATWLLMLVSPQLARETPCYSARSDLRPARCTPTTIPADASTVRILARPAPPRAMIGARGRGLHYVRDPAGRCGP